MAARSPLNSWKTTPVILRRSFLVTIFFQFIDGISEPFVFMYKLFVEYEKVIFSEAFVWFLWERRYLRRVGVQECWAAVGEGRAAQLLPRDGTRDNPGHDSI